MAWLYTLRRLAAFFACCRLSAARARLLLSCCIASSRRVSRFGCPHLCEAYRSVCSSRLNSSVAISRNRCHYLLSTPRHVRQHPVRSFTLLALQPIPCRDAYRPQYSSRIQKQCKMLPPLQLLSIFPALAHVPLWSLLWLGMIPSQRCLSANRQCSLRGSTK